MRHVGGIVLFMHPSSASVRQKACIQSSYHSRLESSGVRSQVESRRRKCRAQGGAL